jgi:hypothetical protein
MSYYSHLGTGLRQDGTCVTAREGATAYDFMRRTGEFSGRGDWSDEELFAHAARRGAEGRSLSEEEKCVLQDKAWRPNAAGIWSPPRIEQHTASALEAAASAAAKARAQRQGKGASATPAVKPKAASATRQQLQQQALARRQAEEKRLAELEAQEFAERQQRRTEAQAAAARAEREREEEAQRQREAEVAKQAEIEAVWDRAYNRAFGKQATAEPSASNTSSAGDAWDHAIASIYPNKEIHNAR